MVEQQIRSLYQEGCTVEQIQEQFPELAPSTINYLLKDEIEDFSEEEGVEMAGIIKAIARRGENERNRLQAAMYCHEVKRGLRAPKSALPTVNAIQLNNCIIQANKNVHRFISGGNGGSDPAAIGDAGSTSVLSEAEAPLADSVANNDIPPVEI